MASPCASSAGSTSSAPISASSAASSAARRSSSALSLASSPSAARHSASALAGDRGEIGEGLDLLRQRRQSRELGVGSLRALASREREAGLLMLRRQVVFAGAGAHRSVVGARERVGSDDRLAQAPLGVVVPLQRDIKRLAGGFARREQRVGFRGEFFTQRGQRAEAGGARGQGFRQPAALSEEVPAALAQRLGGEAELGAELRAIDRPQPALQMIVGQGLVVFVDERVLGALAALQALQRAVRHAQRAADPQQPHIVREVIGRLGREAEQQIADRRERRRLARIRRRRAPRAAPRRDKSSRPDRRTAHRARESAARSSRRRVRAQIVARERHARGDGQGIVGGDFIALMARQLFGDASHDLGHRGGEFGILGRRRQQSGNVERVGLRRRGDPAKRRRPGRDPDPLDPAI